MNDSNQKDHDLKSDSSMHKSNQENDDHKSGNSMSEPNQEKEDIKSNPNLEVRKKIILSSQTHLKSKRKKLKKKIKKKTLMNTKIQKTRFHQEEHIKMCS